MTQNKHTSGQHDDIVCIDLPAGSLSIFLCKFSKFAFGAVDFHEHLYVSHEHREERRHDENHSHEKSVAVVGRSVPNTLKYKIRSIIL